MLAPLDPPQRARRVAVVVAVCLLATVAGAGAVLATGGDSGSSISTITVSDQGCAPQWAPTTSGRHIYSVHDTGSSPEEVSIVGPNHRSVYAALEMVAPGTTLTMVAVLPPGRYSWECEADDGTESYSNEEAVTGSPAPGASPYIPVNYEQLAGAVTLYRRHVTTGLEQLATDTDRLQHAVAAGHLDLAKRLWLVAHLDYARLGAAYDTFGTFATRIDGRADGLKHGVRSPHFTGFLRLEYGLWHGQSVAVLTHVASALDRAVHGLVRAFPTEQTNPNDIALRAHEILENALQFELTGDTDEGSHTNLATVAANIAGTRMALASLAPLLHSVDPQLLHRLSNRLRGLASLFARYHRPDGGWVALQSLSRRQREQLDGAVGEMLEQLSPLPDHLEILLTQDNDN